MTADGGLAGYLEEATRLWPGRPARRVAARSPDTADSYRLTAVPSTRSPRLLVPSSSPRAASASLLRFSSALGPREVASRVGLAAVLRTGLAAAMPGVEVSEGGRSLRRHLADVLGEEVEVSFGLGSARANRKPVLEVFDGRGRRLAFAKVGTTPASTALVSGEADALRRLGEIDLGPALVVPRLISLAAWEGLTVLVMTALPSRARRRGAEVPLPRCEAHALAEAFSCGAGPLDQTPWWSRLVTTGRRLDPVEPRLLALLSALRHLDLDLDDPLEHGAWHGDWTPWNQSSTPQGLALWDWERFETGVPRGLDVCHFAVNTATRREGATTRSIDAGLRVAGLDRGRPHDVRLGVAYLVTIAERYLDDLGHATGEARTMLQQRTSVVLDVADSWSYHDTARMGS